MKLRPMQEGEVYWSNQIIEVNPDSNKKDKINSPTNS